LEKLFGRNTDAQDQLQRRIAELDQKLANLRQHLIELDADTAKALGIYDQANDASQERKKLEVQLRECLVDLPQLPSAEIIRKRISDEFDRLEDVLQAATVEEKRALIANYVKRIKADPNLQEVKISLYPTLLSQKIVCT
jgi:seryl-tRNA synthetase